MASESAGDLAKLAAAAAGWVGLSFAERAILARRTAAAVGTIIESWADVAVRIKRPPTFGNRAGCVSVETVRAEELATGPIGTLRLLLVTAWSWEQIAARGLPQVTDSPRLTHPRTASVKGPDEPLTSFVAVEVMPTASLHDATIFRGHSATVRCAAPGGLDGFLRTWQEECVRRPRSGGVAVVLGAGNVSGLAAGDVISQIFEHGRAVLLKLHPVFAPLEPVLVTGLQPLIEAGLLQIITGGADVASAAIAAPEVTHVHLTGGEETFRRVVAGGDHGPLGKPITCELGNVTPWLIVPGVYSEKALAFQADQVAASIANNSSFNCIATKVIVTCRGWPQRERFIGLVQQRLASLPARPAWYPGVEAVWESLADEPLQDGLLRPVLRADVDPVEEPRWFAREWFVPAAVETALAADSVEAFCVEAAALTRQLPGSLAASVTVPAGLATVDAQRAELLVEHLRYGVVAVNAWSALGYAVGNVPWGGFPGATLERPESGIGHVHDPLLLPLVHNAIVRAPLSVWPMPPWFPWHAKGAKLARGVADLYAAIAGGSRGLWQLAKMLPDVLGGG